jgi:hypothetical protein
LELKIEVCAWDWEKGWEKWVKPGRMVERAVQNGMANYLKWSGRWHGAACGCTSNREVIEEFERCRFTGGM